MTRLRVESVLLNYTPNFNLIPADVQYDRVSCSSRSHSLSIGGKLTLHALQHELIEIIRSAGAKCKYWFHTTVRNQVIVCYVLWETMLFSTVNLDFIHGLLILWLEVIQGMGSGQKVVFHLIVDVNLGANFIVEKSRNMFLRLLAYCFLYE